MRVEYRLVGLSADKKASIELLDSDKETFEVPVEMSDDTFGSMFKYCKGNWSDLKHASIECDGVLESGSPVNGVMIEFYEPVSLNKIKSY